MYESINVKQRRKRIIEIVANLLSFWIPKICPTTIIESGQQKNGMENVLG
nr:MAG TPA: hypothetical protein [Caudoviricetes sp.]